MKVIIDAQRTKVDLYGINYPSKCYHKEIEIKYEPFNELVDSQADSQMIGLALAEAYEKGADLVRVTFFPPKLLGRLSEVERE